MEKKVSRNFFRTKKRKSPTKRSKSKKEAHQKKLASTNFQLNRSQPIVCSDDSVMDLTFTY